VKEVEEKKIEKEGPVEKKEDKIDI